MPPRRLSIHSLLPADSVLDLTGWGGVPEEWQREIPVRANLSIPEVAELFELEGQIKSLARPQDLKPILERAYARVMSILRERNPQLPDLPLDVKTTLDLMGWLAGGDEFDSVEENVRDALSSGDGPAPMLTDEEAAELLETERLAEEGGGAAAAAEAPLPSKKPSRRRSSRSATGSAGSPSGGSRAAGARSAATSRTSKPKADAA